MKGQDFLVPPPRHVPLSTWITLHFGGTVSVLGWGFLALGMFFVLVLGSAVVDFSELAKFRGPLRTVQAEITGAEETSIEVNDEKVIHWFYRYEVDGQTFDGACYDEGEEYDKEERVTVEFPPGYPELARIVGGRRGAVPVWVLLLIGIFPAIGLTIAIPGLRSGRKAHRLLRFGVLTRGTLQSKEPTSMVINNQPVHKLTFAFSPEGHSREFICVARTHVTKVLQDEAEERLLYLPSDPFLSVMLDSLSGGVEISSDGRYVPANALNAVFLSCAPSITLILSLVLLLRVLL